MKFTANQLARVCAATVGDAERYVEHLNSAMAHFDINNLARVAKFCGQIAVESRRLSVVEENLSYSAERLTKVWPSRFPTIAAAQPYARNPQRLANKVYSNRMGNGNEASGDGWLYRGRGLKQLTGKNNYMAAEDGLGMLLTGPNVGRAAEPDGAAWTACWFWYVNGCNEIADGEDLELLTRTINGGLTGHEDGNDWGLDDRVELMQYATVQLMELGFA